MVDKVIELASELARPFEGLFLRPYYCPAGYPTQGYGRLLSRDRTAPLTRWPPIDVATAQAWLAEDLAGAYRAVRRLCPVPLLPSQAAALVDFAFNCGAGNLQISALRHAVLLGDFERAAGQFERWVYARGVKLPGLVRRRAAERQLFESGL